MKAGAVALKVRNSREVSTGAKPWPRNLPAREPVLAVSVGPKQPKQPLSTDGQRAPQPALVTGPRQGVPRDTSKQAAAAPCTPGRRCGPGPEDGAPPRWP